MQATIAEILKQTSVKQAKLSSAHSSPTSQCLSSFPPEQAASRKRPESGCRINVGRIEMQTLAQQIRSDFNQDDN